MIRRFQNTGGPWRYYCTHGVYGEEEEEDTYTCLTYTQVGFGDITAQNTSERVGFSLLFIAGFISLYVGPYLYVHMCTLYLYVHVYISICTCVLYIYMHISVCGQRERERARARERNDSN
jgi:hypothetical protein